MVKRLSNKKKLTANELSPEQVQALDKKLFIVTAVILILWGIYQSINYFAHQAVPNPDFTSFIDVARRVLSFEIPTGSKRAPLLGIMQIAFGKLTPTQYPNLTGAWLLNSVLHPINILLMWLIARQLIGKAGLWITIIAVINPMTIYLLTEPLAETPLLFFILLTFFLMFRRSGFCYLTAALSAMIRYEGAALILAAFVMDLALSENKKQRLYALLYAALASIPLIVWVIATAPDTAGKTSGHYLQLINPERYKDAIPRLTSLWEVTFSPFRSMNSYLDNKLTNAFVVILKTTSCLSAFLCLINSIMKRRWKMIAMFLFFVPYIIVHILYEFSTPRFYATVHWMFWVFFIDGAVVFLQFLCTRYKNAVALAVILQLTAIVLCLTLTAQISPLLSQLKTISPASSPFPFVALAVVIIAIVCRRLFVKEKVLPLIAVFFVMLLTTTANQKYLASLMGHGTRSIEFKYLADWFRDNAPEDKKLVSTLSNVIQIFVPHRENDIMHVNAIPGKDMKKFADACWKRKAVYVAWDSRAGSVKNINYKQWGLERVAILNRTEDVGPYKFVTQFKNPHNETQYINLFELRSD